jgi:AcrR family transcriptional regulator
MTKAPWSGITRTRGYRAVTMVGIARRVKRARASIYRRWPSKPHLVADCILTTMGASPAPDTGVLRKDLRAAQGPTRRRRYPAAGVLGTSQARTAGSGRGHGTRPRTRAGRATPGACSATQVDARRAGQGPDSRRSTRGSGLRTGTRFPGRAFVFPGAVWTRAVRSAQDARRRGLRSEDRRAPSVRGQHVHALRRSFQGPGFAQVTVAIRA